MGCNASRDADGNRISINDETVDWFTSAVEGHVQEGAVVLVDDVSRLKDDRQTVLEAVRVVPRAIKLADSRYRKDHEIIMAVVRQNGRMLSEADESLIDDVEIVTTAVQQFGQALQYAGHAARNTFSIVMAAVKNDGWSVQFASDKLCKDETVCLAAVEQRPRALRYVDQTRQLEWILIRAAVKGNGLVLGRPFVQEAGPNCVASHKVRPMADGDNSSGTETSAAAVAAAEAEAEAVRTSVRAMKKKQVLAELEQRDIDFERGSRKEALQATLIENMTAALQDAQRAKVVEASDDRIGAVTITLGPGEQERLLAAGSEGMSLWLNLNDSNTQNAGSVKVDISWKPGDSSDLDSNAGGTLSVVVIEAKDLKLMDYEVNVAAGKTVLTNDVYCTMTVGMEIRRTATITSAIQIAEDRVRRPQWNGGKGERLEWPGLASMPTKFMLTAWDDDPEKFDAAQWEELCLLAVAQDGRALEFVGKALQADFRVIEVAVTQTSKALQFVGPSIKDHISGMSPAEIAQWLSTQNQTEACKQDPGQFSNFKEALLRGEATDAALKVQAHFRGHRVRAQLQAKRKEQADADDTAGHGMARRYLLAKTQADLTVHESVLKAHVEHGKEREKADLAVKLAKRKAARTGAQEDWDAVKNAEIEAESVRKEGALRIQNTKSSVDAQEKIATQLGMEESARAGFVETKGEVEKAELTLKLAQRKASKTGKQSDLDAVRKAEAALVAIAGSNAIESDDAQDDRNISNRLAQARKAREKRVETAFQALDANGDGFISIEQLRAEIEKLGNFLSGDEKKQLLLEADFDGNGKIDFFEFSEAMQKLHDMRAQKRAAKEPRSRRSRRESQLVELQMEERELARLKLIAVGPENMYVDLPPPPEYRTLQEKKGAALSRAHMSARLLALHQELEPALDGEHYEQAEQVAVKIHALEKIPIAEDLHSMVDDHDVHDAAAIPQERPAVPTIALPDSSPKSDFQEGENTARLLDEIVAEYSGEPSDVPTIDSADNENTNLKPVPPQDGDANPRRAAWNQK